MSVDDEDAKKLKDALWLAVGKAVEEATIESGRNMSTTYTAVLTELVWDHMETVAKDLEMFSRHAGRKVITTDDVLLLARRNEDLQGLIQRKIDKLNADKVIKKKAKPGRA